MCGRILLCVVQFIQSPFLLLCKWLCHNCPYVMFLHTAKDFYGKYSGPMNVLHPAEVRELSEVTVAEHLATSPLVAKFRCVVYLVCGCVLVACVDVLVCMCSGV